MVPQKQPCATVNNRISSTPPKSLKVAQISVLAAKPPVRAARKSSVAAVGLAAHGDQVQTRESNGPPRQRTGSGQRAALTALALCLSAAVSAG